MLEEKLRRALTATKVVIHPADFVVFGLPLRTDDLLSQIKLLPPYFVLRDRYEITLVVTAKVWARISNKFRKARLSRPWKLITMKSPTELELVGYFATLTRALASHGIAVNAFSAYSRDHLLVKKADMTKAKAVLVEMSKV